MQRQSKSQMRVSCNNNQRRIHFGRRRPTSTSGHHYHVCDKAWWLPVKLPSRRDFRPEIEHWAQACALGMGLGPGLGLTLAGPVLTFDCYSPGRTASVVLPIACSSLCVVVSNSLRESGGRNWQMVFSFVYLCLCLVINW